MAHKRKSWTEKLNVSISPKVVKLKSDFAGIKEGESMLVATPLIVDEYIRQIPKGKSVQPIVMRNDLAAEHHADKTCPVSTGIFLRIVAESAYEQYQDGVSLKKITPFWRVIDEQSPTAKKLTFGTAFLKEQRQKEGLS